MTTTQLQMQRSTPHLASAHTFRDHCKMLQHVWNPPVKNKKASGGVVTIMQGRLAHLGR